VNAAVVSGFYDAINAKDGDALGALIADHFALDASIVWPASLPYGGTVSGAAKLGRLFTSMLAAPAPIGPDKVSVLGLVDGGDQVAAQLSFDWFAPGSSSSIASGALELWSFADGLVTEIRAYYWDTAELVSAPPG
jgi:ketosteroid isomerase-like protein